MLSIWISLKTNCWVKSLLNRCFHNTIPDDKNSALSKLKAFADDSLNVDQMMQFLLHGVENIFSFSFNIFKSLLSQGRLKSA